MSEPATSLPASAQQVLRTLSEKGALTHRDLVAATGMPPRTVRWAVGKLRDAGIVDARCNLMDCRQCFFYLSEQCGGKAEYPRTNVVAFAGIRERALNS